MATVNLLPRKEFEIVLDDNTKIHGKYGIWAVKRFCDKRGLTLVRLQEYMNADNLTLDMVQDVLLCAVEQWHRENKQSFSYTDLDACSWIDQLGGITSEEYTKLSMHAYSEEKKSEQETQQTSKTSSVFTMLPGERKTNSGEEPLTKSG